MLIGVAALRLPPLVSALCIAVAVDTVSLFVWGLVSGLGMKAGVGVALLSGLANLAIGRLVIVVKLAAGH